VKAVRTRSEERGKEQQQNSRAVQKKSRQMRSEVQGRNLREVCMVPTEPSDADLMETFCACSEAAYAELVRRQSGALFRFFHNNGCSREDAEELVQEALTSVYLTKTRETARFDTSRALTPWLFALARRRLIDHTRKRRPTPSQLPDEISEKQLPKVDSGIEADLENCVSKLSEEELEVVLLSKEGLGELTQTEIAEQLGVSVSTVNRRLANALQNLRRCMQDKGHA
jgi:RNA polymerase sigma-70 factor, ECF subfamily